MNTCKDCKHWAGSWRYCNSKQESRPRCGSCSCPKLRQGYEYGFEEGGCAPDECAIETDEGWGIETGPDFGCIHWEAK